MLKKWKLIVVILSLVALLIPATVAQATHDAIGVPFSVGDVFAGIGGGQVAHYSSSGTLLHTLDSGLGITETTGMAFDSAGNLYVTFFQANKIAKFDNSGNLIGLIPHVFNSHAESIVFDASGNFYVGSADGLQDIYKFDSGGNLITQYDPAVESRGTDWIDLAADQSTIFYTSEGYQVKRFDVSTNTQLPDFATLTSRPSYALRIRTNGEVLVASSSQVVRLNADGSVNQTYPKPAAETSFLFALNLDPDGTSFWTAGYGTGNIYKIDISTGTILTSFTAPPIQTLAGLAVFGEPTVGNPGGKTVDIDIKPTSCPNPLNTKGNGVLPVAILGTESFDINEIDVTTVTLEGVTPLRWAEEDVATPYEGEFSDPLDRTDCITEGPDGYTDLTFKFAKADIVAVLGEVDDGDVLVLTLEGELLDGTPFTGQDVIWIVKK